MTHSDTSKFPKLYGFHKASEAGVDIFAPSLFLGGCNLRCPYCMNSKLVLLNTPFDDFLSEAKAFVLEEKSEWFMLSGGEPTLAGTESLSCLIQEIKSWGCKVGISTNGCLPDVLESILPILNYVALDIKSSESDAYQYISFNKDPSTFSKVMTSRGLLAKTKMCREDFDYEIRTTLYPIFIDEKSLREIGSVIQKSDKWILQQFRHSNNMLSEACRSISPLPESSVLRMMQIAQEYCNNVSLRYV